MARVRIVIEGETANLAETAKLAAAMAAAVSGHATLETLPERIDVPAATEADKTALAGKLGVQK